jgi:hypothetical protein
MDYNHDIVREYIAASKELSSYFKAHTCEPPEVSKRHKLALENIRCHLDNLNLKMPKAIYPFEYKNKKTWRFSDVILSDDRKTERKFVRNVVNPDWIYK